MESENTELSPANGADAALAGIADDRRALVREVARTSPWYYPAVSLLAAIVVWAPAIGSPVPFTVVVALCALGLMMLDSLRERTSGVTMPRPAGRRGWAILIAVGAVFIALIAASFALVVAGRSELSLVCAAVAFVAMFVLAWLYDASFIAQQQAS
ncbi:hypothetical protein [Promicromonospora sp. NPDC023987]|uniref:hypothetical protein n=1 Tax=Promicromonospora sp. NPDC023987 TaxID=3155360 RepID=UPI0033E57552